MTNTPYSKYLYCIDGIITGYSLSDQRNILSINPKYEDRLFEKLHVQYMAAILVRRIFQNPCRNSKQSRVKCKFFVNTILFYILG